MKRLSAPIFVAFVIAPSLLGCSILKSFSSSHVTNSELERVGKDVPAAQLGDVSLTENPNAALGLPGNLSKVSEVLISRAEYVLSYNAKNRGVNWAVWRLTANDIGQGRTGRWDADPTLGDYLHKFSADPVGFPDYKGSCFDRGHMVPSGDRNKNPEMNKVTFYLSNVLPQTGYINRVPWNHLEMHERSLVSANRPEVFIYSGPIFEEDLGYIGPQKDIRVPSAFFKVILSKKLGVDSSVADSELPMAVIMPNVLSDGQKPNANPEKHCAEFSDSNLGDRSAPQDDWKKYVTTIAEVEKRSGFDIPEVNALAPVSAVPASPTPVAPVPAAPAPAASAQ
jgi:endonuclease G